ncbi:hypothetical protein SAMN06272737_104162 [Blastococcus mobilis]|uniref:Uncharacterized protein n=2 Tax=Blastococcus mobilis TaxID=1938746 RepID=A0A238VQV4_9ACTN|nr:hypothetical protein SAMN06272737_104162 [Blastococcus mobilis]
MRNRALFTVLAGAALLPALVTPAFGSDGQYDDRWDAETYHARLDPVPHHPRPTAGPMCMASRSWSKSTAT